MIMEFSPNAMIKSHANFICIHYIFKQMKFQFLQQIVFD